ncbi:MAG: hypothetical protein K2N25_00620, partial [Muribaculaceae bacterium]|nr:hypothetical protein [Muribaculaceae bacterium]
SCGECGANEEKKMMALAMNNKSTPRRECFLFQLAIITSKFMSLIVRQVRANWRIISMVALRGDFIDC